VTHDRRHLIADIAPFTSTHHQFIKTETAEKKVYINGVCGRYEDATMARVKIMILSRRRKALSTRDEMKKM
ncbi:MAG: hypothetical protein P8J22_16550, partial [Pseudomonadales bacterium]|nr:hypothetical protein [Pseudomonadales bacterium]